MLIEVAVKSNEVPCATAIGTKRVGGNGYGTVPRGCAGGISIGGHAAQCSISTIGWGGGNTDMGSIAQSSAAADARRLRSTGGIRPGVGIGRDIDVFVPLRPSES